MDKCNNNQCLAYNENFDTNCGHYYKPNDVTNCEYREDKKNQIKPTYYNGEGMITPFDYIKANKLNFFEGNIIKYITRHQNKNGLEDLQKAKTYLDYIIENYKEVYKK